MTRRLVLWLLVSLSACGGKKLDTEALEDPETCQGCHPNHFEEWSGSMHAYAAEDPVFLAMNERGQRETNGALGDFCISCHAPMAVRLGLTTDGLNLEDVPQKYKGITCYFCHQVSAVEGTHNNPLTLALDGAMRGAIADPSRKAPHDAEYSVFHDRNKRESADMCGACHDIVTPAGVHLERTYLEWQGSIFNGDGPGQFLSCGGCHMTGRDGTVADVEGVQVRKVHDHSFPGVDVALTDFPQKEAQRAAVQADLDPTVSARLCVSPLEPKAEVFVYLDNLLAGHNWPSGAAQDRRAWVQMIATDTAGNVIYETGRVPDGTAATDLPDPDLWLIREKLFDANGDEVHMFWEAERTEGELLGPSVTNDPTDPRFFHARQRRYELPSLPARIELIVRLRPMGLDVLQSLVDSGDLDPRFLAEMPTFELEGTRSVWTWDETGYGCVPK